jgi:hypothetical protein
MKKIFFKEISPMKNYSAPNFPTLENARENFAFRDELKKLPARWQKKTAVLTCMGLMGFAALTGCANNLAITNVPVNGPAPVDIHYGGDGGESVPFYVAHPTEEEILARLEAAALAYADFRAQLETAEINISSHFGGAGAGPFYVAYFTEQEAFGLSACSWKPQVLILTLLRQDILLMSNMKRFTKPALSEKRQQDGQESVLICMMLKKM